MGSLIQIRRDSSSNWTTANVVLASGELAYETNTGKIKVGDGQTDWANVGYFPGNIVTPTVTTTTAVSPFGAGFANMVVLTSGLSWTIPEAMRVDGAKWKVTLVGGGGGGAGTTGGVAGRVGGGGGSGAVSVGFYAYSVSGGNTMTYSIGTAGSAGATAGAGGAGGNTTVTYDSVTYTANGGAGGLAESNGGAGGTATGGVLNFTGTSGKSGGTMAATSNYVGNGGDTSLGLGRGGRMPQTAAGAVGVAGVNYGSGGSGGRNGTGTTQRTGGAGAAGVIIIEY